MKFFVSLAAIVLILYIVVTLFGALSDMYVDYLNDLLRAGLGI